MSVMKLRPGRSILAVAAWILAAGSLPAQYPGVPYSIPGVGIGYAAGFGLITNNFGATGVGSSPYGNFGHLSLGISGGGGGNGTYGALNRYGRPSPRTASELDTLFGPARPVENVAFLRVILPTPDAQLWVNDTLMKKQGTERSFISPFLLPDKQFIYDMKVRYKDRQGRTVEQTRSLVVQAGAHEIVDFTQAPVGR